MIGQAKKVLSFDTLVEILNFFHQLIYQSLYFNEIYSVRMGTFSRSENGSVLWESHNRMGIGSLEIVEALRLLF